MSEERRREERRAAWDLSRARAAPMALLDSVGNRWDRLVAFLARRDWDEGTLLLIFAVAIGVGAGLGVAAFYKLIDLAYFVFVTSLGARLGVGEHAIYRPLLTAAGLWAAWAIVRRARLRDGQNVADVQLAVAKRGGKVESRPVAVRTLAAAVTLGSGGSAGSEGPVAVLGSAIGSGIGRVLRFHPRRVKILVGCGAAAGISGAFNAPFAGAFFALEEVLGSFSVGAFSPVVVASVAGALTVRPLLGSHPAFAIPSYGESEAWTIALLYPILGVACGLCSIVFTRAYFAAGPFARRLPGPRAALPIASGLIVGTIVLFSDGLLVGNGHLAIPAPVFGGIAWYLLIGLAFAKIAVTVLTLQGGGSGGVFTPTLFIGAALGGGVGVLAREVLPTAGVHPETWGLVGMAGLVAGATRAPITAIFIVFELTNDYTIVLPLMIVTVIAYVIAKRYSAHGLYDGWLAARGEHLAHGADRAIMDRIQAREALDREAVTVSPGATLADIVAATANTRHTTIVVVEDDGSLVGVITYHELRQAMLDRGDLAPLLLAADLAAPTEIVTPRDSLRSALREMNARAIDALPVVESASSPRFVGILSRADVLAAYERELMHQV
ncbi:MAG: chloride channel protein [Gemmatimonadaceae bacterium]